MDVQDGFILNIYNYCDSWCETCAFTSRCRVFADRAEMEAQLDPNLQAIVDAPLLPQDIPPSPPPWMQELIDEMNRAANEALAEDEPEPPRPNIPPDHEDIEARAHAYGNRVHSWLEKRGFNSQYESADPRAVIGWFQYSISAKIHRAVHGLAQDDPKERDWPADHDGSAKVALLGIERSHAGWLLLVHRTIASAAEVEPFIADLMWLSEELDRVFPNARNFVRQAIDEPDEVAKLLAMEGVR